MTRGAGRVRTKTIFDPIHGPIVLSGAALELVGDPAFQRLWGIRQTGLAHLVFPGANHTRLEHSLGVYGVARRLAGALDLTPERAEMLEVGGLLHDLGHAPLSHTLDGPLVEVTGAGHEARSRAILVGEDPGDRAGAGSPSQVPAILEAHGLRPTAVADLIDPPPTGRGPRDLEPLLHGAIDADRIDYLQRDAHYTGVAHGAIDATRLLETIRLDRGEIVFAEKGRNAVEGFAVGRSLMYSSVYFHKTVRAAEIMAQAAVEHLPGYPVSAAAVLARTDADLLTTLASAGGIASRLGRALEERRLYKRAAAWRELPPAAIRSARRLWRRPGERRALEAALAEDVGAPDGSVLLDLAGVVEESVDGSDWSHVGIVEDDRVTYPFRAAGVWREIARRPRTPWRVAVYADPRVVRNVARRLARSRGPIP